MRNADKACRFIMCAECCQANKATVCSLHGSGQRAAQGLVEGACEDKPVEIDLRYSHIDVTTVISTVNANNVSDIDLDQT